MKITLLSILLGQVVLVSSAFGNKDAIHSVRSARLQQVATALSSADADALRAALSSAHQTMSKEEALALLTTISKAWVELTQLEPVVANDNQPILDKGDMRIVASWGNMPTQSGEWLTFRSARRKNTHLRIGLLFGKGDGHAGQFLVCEFTAPEQTTPDAGDAQ